MKKTLIALVALGILWGAPLGAAELKVGASPAPHGEILAQVVEDLQAQGVELQILEFADYVTPNLAMADGDLDANYFQHIPYLESFCRDRGLDLVSAGSVHIEPMGIYSNKVQDLSELSEGATVAIPNDPTNSGRALLLLQAQGLITLAGGAGLEATELDVDENPRKLRFRALEAAQLPRVLADVDAAVINGNYAIEAGLSPTDDAVALEGGDSPYVNVVALRQGDQDRPEIKILMEALQSEKVRDFIVQRYKGAVIPVFQIQD